MVPALNTASVVPVLQRPRTSRVGVLVALVVLASVLFAVRSEEAGAAGSTYYKDHWYGYHELGLSSVHAEIAIAAIKGGSAVAALTAAISYFAPGIGLPVTAVSGLIAAILQLGGEFLSGVPATALV